MCITNLGYCTQEEKMKYKNIFFFSFARIDHILSCVKRVSKLNLVFDSWLKAGMNPRQIRSLAFFLQSSLERDVFIVGIYK